MCKFKAERLIKEALNKRNCKFVGSRLLKEGVLIVIFIGVHGDYRDAIFPYRFMNEKDIENMVMRVVY